MRQPKTYTLVDEEIVTHFIEIGASSKPVAEFRVIVTAKDTEGREYHGTRVLRMRLTERLPE